MSNITYKFYGMNNVDDSASVGAPVPKIRDLVFTEVVRLTNVDADNNGIVKRRQGRTLLKAGNFSSMYANDDIFVAVSGYELLQVWPATATTTLLKTLISPNVMDFTETPVGIVFTNGEDIGVINNGSVEDIPEVAKYLSENPVPVPSNKVRVPPGQFVAWFNGMIYVLAFEFGESILYHTDGYSLELDDLENYFRGLGRPKMLAAVDSGIYVSTGDTTVFLSGDGPEDFQERLVAHYPAIPHTSKTCKAELFNIDGVHGTVVVWASTRGICLGANDGQFINLSQGKVSYQPGKVGTAIIKELNGIVQYVVSMRNPSADYNKYTPKDVVIYQ